MDKEYLLYSEELDRESIEKLKGKHLDKSLNSTLEVNDLFNEKIALLQQFIEEINQEIHDLQKLINGALKEIEDELNQLSVLLKEVAPLGKVEVSGTHLDSRNSRRIHLEKSIARLNELRRTHKINTWKDIVALKGDLFKLLPEYTQLLQLKKVME